MSATDPVFLVPVGTGSSAPFLTPHGHVCDHAGMTVMAMPPGKVNLRLADIPMALNFIPEGGGVLRRHRLDGERVRRFGIARDFATSYRAGQELELDCTNTAWELLVELDETRLGSLTVEAFDGRVPALPGFNTRIDPVAGTLARLAIAHLRSTDIDPLYIDGLGVALLARSLRSIGAGEIWVSTKGTDRRVRRAMDYAEAHLDTTLGLTGLAAVASMSSSWFSRCFVAATGQSVHVWVRERRLERARVLMGTTERSLESIAHACGFASQSHFTTRFREAHGTTPGRWRADVRA